MVGEAKSHKMGLFDFVWQEEMFFFSCRHHDITGNIGKSTWWCGSLESARGRSESRIAVAMAVISPMLRLVAVRDTSHQKVFDQPEQFRSKFSKEVGISVEFDGKPGAVSYSMQLPQDVAARQRVEKAVREKFFVEEIATGQKAAVHAMEVDEQAAAVGPRAYVVKIDLAAGSLLSNLQGRAVRQALLGSLSPMPVGAAP